ncbi:hypothetical protein AALP_AAs53955U000100 [Arabis alpina]|uniref:Delta-aminolevulinic acid dehydratase n=1 Tax=Arabis alpina TaxID=50452 RepID=A0A087FX95_ARAAL|nr:hypothetical protein AALP_AAs53955U000100 [Arabis alpina]
MFLKHLRFHLNPAPVGTPITQPLNLSRRPRLREDGVIMNDETVHQLCKQAVSQMEPGNYREALLEARLDEAEGADILLVKPGLPYLDIIQLLHNNTSLPIAAYQVSGEYSMIKAGGILKMINEEQKMMESLMCLRQAGADIIVTYFALQAATFLCGL